EAVERELRTVEAALARARAALAESGEAVSVDGPERPARPQPQAPDPRRLRPPQPLTGEVERARLLSALRADPPGRLVVVWGVAGSGKTTLLAQWAARQTTRLTAWLALEPGERDPARLVAAVLAAVRAAGGEAPGDPRARREREDLAALLDRLAGSRPVLLVLVEATDGWAGGLSLAGVARSSGAPGEEAEGWLVDYAERDMLSGVPDELIAFLTDVRVLAPLSSAPCAAVSGRPDAPALLREARRRDLVVADDRGGWRPRRPVSGA